MRIRCRNPNRATELSPTSNTHRCIPFTLATPTILSSLRSFSFCNANHARRRRSTQNCPSFPSQRSFNSPLHLFLHHHSSNYGSQDSPFPNSTSALTCLSFTPESSCRRPPRSSISTVCVAQTDGQFPLLAVFSRDWNVN